MKNINFYRNCIFIFLALYLFPEMDAYAQLPQTGRASYYAEKFHGRTTANGERFNMWQMTAAHRTLPFGTKVKVTNLRNKKSIVVRINDRGPFKPGRIIDLSKGAAAKIDMIRSGTAKVRVESAVAKQKLTVEPGEYYSINVKKNTIQGFGIQIVSYMEFDNLMRKLHALSDDNLGNLYIQVAEVEGKQVYRVILASFKTKEEAEQRLATIKSRVKNAFVLELQ
jgi:peptidoglycan lytic transglycosylase